jgi:Uma2 family endonuclease
MATTVRAAAEDTVMALNIGPGGLDRLLDLVGEDRSVPRIKYRDGRAILVSPSHSHERSIWLLNLLLTAVCTELSIGFRGCRSTLFRKPGFDHGIEPDLSYYVRNVEAVRKVRGKVIDLSVYPPPDLIVEVVVSHGAAMAMEVCRELGVPEMWVFDVNKGRMTFYRLGRRGGYVARQRSLAFPFLLPADLPPWLEDSDASDTAEFARMQQWARDVLGPRRK